MAQRLQEAGATLSRTGNRWRIKAITPGKGSSGVYTEEVLRETGPAAFPKGTHCYVNHLKEGETRNPEKILGVFTEDASYEDGVGLVAELEVFPHWKDFVEAVGPHVGLSISAMGEGRQDGDDYIVEALLPNLQNSVDLVSYPGRGGALLDRLYESATKPEATSAQETQKKKEDMEEILKRFTALEAALAPVIAFVNESQTALAAKAKAEAQVEVDGAAVTEALVALTGKYEAIEAAELPKEITESLRKQAAEGTDVAPLIEFAKTVAGETKKTLEEAGFAGHVVGSAATDGDLVVAGWGTR